MDETITTAKKENFIMDILVRRVGLSPVSKICVCGYTLRAKGGHFGVKTCLEQNLVLICSELAHQNLSSNTEPNEKTNGSVSG